MVASVMELSVARAVSSISLTTTLRHDDAEGPPLGRRSARVAREIAARRHLLEQADDVEQGDALGVPAEPVAAPRPAQRLDQAGPPQRPQHLREVVARDPEALRDVAGRELARRVGREVEHSVQRNSCRDLESHGAPAPVGPPERPGRCTRPGAPAGAEIAARERPAAPGSSRKGISAFWYIFART
jgi:hypothetical protein